jgi:hypothetical protein
VNNRDEAAKVGERYCDRSIHHLLWLHSHGYEVAPSLDRTIEILTTSPKTLGIGYPVNSCWRHWAWTRLGRVDLVLKELREVWTQMYSVKNNGTIQEMWNIQPGTTSMMSHCGVIPNLDMHTAIFGLGHTPEGEIFIRPQLSDLESIEIGSTTQHGFVSLKAVKVDTSHECLIIKPLLMPLRLRTVAPISEHSVACGSEFETDLTSVASATFKIDPYPMNHLISDTCNRGE